MRRRVRNETQETVSDWAKDRDLRTPDETMHGFLDAVKDLEVVWFTGEYHDVSDRIGDAVVELLLSATSVNINVQDALNAAMNCKRKEE